MCMAMWCERFWRDNSLGWTIAVFLFFLFAASAIYRFSVQKAQALDDNGDFLGLGGIVHTILTPEPLELLLQVGGMHHLGLEYLERSQSILGLTTYSQ